MRGKVQSKGDHLDMGTSTDVTVSRSVAKSMHSRGTDSVSRPGTTGLTFADEIGLGTLLGPVQPVFSIGLVNVVAP